ncbi:MAG: zf-TFIIB domain-containing protein [Hyphomicrobiaceae bacterium]|nr:zf-TFIIB domain-containing protein [Hyphomicrobiaceae bacterium]
MSVIGCPVCRGEMREISRNGVLIDTCTQCRGVWLDRGELEKLSAYIGDEPDGRRAGDYGNRRRYRDRDDDDDDDRYRGTAHGQHQPSKMKRFLDFFD